MTPRCVGTPIAPDILERLKAAAGPGGALEDPADTAPYCKSFRDGWVGRVPLVLRPQTTAAVADVVRICAEAASASSRRAEIPGSRVAASLMRT